MFIGEFIRSIDHTGKLVLPRTFGAGLAAGLVVTRGFERNLMVFTRSGWRDMADKVVEQSLFSSESRALRRRLFANAAEGVPDRNGRNHPTGCFVRICRIGWSGGIGGHV